MDKKPLLEKRKTVHVNGKEFEVIGQVFEEPVKKIPTTGELFFTVFSVINVTQGKVHDRFYISQVLTPKELELNVEEASKNINDTAITGQGN